MSMFHNVPPVPCKSGTLCWHPTTSSVAYDGKIESIAMAEGRIVNTGSGNYQYEYYLQDHLYTNRVAFRVDTNGALNLASVQNYYPFGRDMGDSTMNYSSSPQNLYKYEGKEQQPELNLNTYDFGARHYDPVLGRWTAIDPLAEESEDLSPYNYVENNPMNLMDPDGMQPNNGCYNWGGGNSWGSGWDWGGAGLSAGSSIYNASNAFSWGKVTKTNWNSNLGKVQQNPKLPGLGWGPEAMYLGNLAQDLQHGYDNLKAVMRQAPWETASSLIKGLRSGSIKNAVIHSTVKNTIKFSRGNWLDKGAVWGTFVGEVLQLGFAEADFAKAGEMGELEKLGEVVKNGETASTALGRTMHKAYKAADVLAGVRIKEFSLPSGKRIDFIDLENKIIYELKPNNPRAIRMGNNQLQMYMEELKTMPRFKGIKWEKVLDTY